MYCCSGEYKAQSYSRPHLAELIIFRRPTSEIDDNFAKYCDPK